MAVPPLPRRARMPPNPVDVLRRRGWKGTMDGLPTVDGRDGAGDGGRDTGPDTAADGWERIGRAAGDDG